MNKARRSLNIWAIDDDARRHMEVTRRKEVTRRTGNQPHWQLCVIVGGGRNSMTANENVFLSNEMSVFSDFCHRKKYCITFQRLRKTLQSCVQDSVAGWHNRYVLRSIPAHSSWISRINFQHSVSPRSKPILNITIIESCMNSFNLPHFSSDTYKYLEE